MFDPGRLRLAASRVAYQCRCIRLALVASTSQPKTFDPWTVIHFFSPVAGKRRSSAHHADVTLCSHLLRQKQRAVSKGGAFIFQGFEVETEKCCCAMCCCDIERGVSILKPGGGWGGYSTGPQLLKGFLGRLKLFLDPFIMLVPALCSHLKALSYWVTRIPCQG